MKKGINKVFHSLHTFSSEDDHLIRSTNHPKIFYRFNIIGLFVILISLISLSGGTILMYHILDSNHKFFSFPIGLFFGFVVTLIYLFLLYTITPPLLKDKKNYKSFDQEVSLKNKDSSENRDIFIQWLTLSIITRILFILIFACIIYQPFNVMFFKSTINSDLQTFKTLKKADLIIRSDSVLIEREIQFYSILKQKESVEGKTYSTQGLDEKITRDSLFLDEGRTLIHLIEQGIHVAENESKLSKLLYSEIQSDSLFVNQILSNNNREILQIIQVLEEKNISHTKILASLQNTDFYIKQIRLVYEKNPISYFFTLLFSFLFIYPIYLKFNVRNIDLGDGLTFYHKKHEIEHEFVLRSYQIFKDEYELTLNQVKEKNKAELLNNLSPYFLQLNECGVNHKARNYNQRIDDRFGFKIERYEKYEDPPFNLKIKRENKVIKNSLTLIQEVWS